MCRMDVMKLELYTLVKFSDCTEEEIKSSLGNALNDENEIELLYKLLQYNFGYSETNYIEKDKFLFALTRQTLNAFPYIKELSKINSLFTGNPIDRTITRNKNDSKTGSVTTKTKVATTPTLKGLSEDYVDEYSDTQSKSTGESEDTTTGNENISESVSLVRIIELQSEHRDVIVNILNNYYSLFQTYLA